MKPPAPRNREYDVRRSRARSEFEVTLVLERVIRNRHDLALDQNLARCGLLAPIAHHSVPEGFAVSRSGLQSWIDDELALHSTVTQSALDATPEGVGACRLRDKFNG